MRFEDFNDKGECIAISVWLKGVHNSRLGYVAHLLLGVKKGWKHADNLAQRLWRKPEVEELKPYQLTAVINELRTQNKDVGMPL